MIFAEPYQSSPGGLQDQITNYLSGLVPAGAVNSGVAVVLAVVTVILATLGYHHARRGTWLNGWLSGPVAVLASLLAAFYAARGLPVFAGVAPTALDPRALFVDVVVALLAAVLVGGAACPVAAHVSASRGAPTTLTDLREWALTDRLPAAGGALAGGALAWIVVDPLTCVAGAVLGLLVTVTVVTLRSPAVARSAPTQPPAVQPGHPQPPAVPPPVRAPAHPAVSDEDW